MFNFLLHIVFISNMGRVVTGGIGLCKSEVTKELTFISMGLWYYSLWKWLGIVFLSLIAALVSYSRQHPEISFWHTNLETSSLLLYMECHYTIYFPFGINWNKPRSVDFLVERKLSDYSCAARPWNSVVCAFLWFIMQLLMFISLLFRLILPLKHWPKPLTNGCSGGWLCASTRL